MATALTRDLKRKSDEAGQALSERVEQVKSHMTPLGVALTAVGVAALAGFVAATIYYSPDFVRYLKIRRM